MVDESLAYDYGTCRYYLRILEIRHEGPTDEPNTSRNLGTLVTRKVRHKLQTAGIIIVVVGLDFVVA